MIKLSVIIPTFNRRSVLERTLPTLMAQDFPADAFEILVVDDGSTDGTLELLRDWKSVCAFRALKAPHRGAGAARNVGIHAAVGEYVLFLDDDLLTPPDLLRQHYEAQAESRERHIVHGPIYVAPGSAKTIIRHITELFYAEYNRSLTAEMELRYPEGIGPRIAMLSSMVNSSMPREALLRVGGFDEGIWAAEDLELGLRLWKMGLPLHCRPSAFVHEFYVKSSDNYLRRQAMALGPGDLRATHKHPEYRPYSSMAAFGETRTGKRWLRNLVMRLPVSPAPLLALPLRLEKSFFDIVPLRNAGVRIFRVAERIQRLRSGYKAAGSWKKLEAEFDQRLPALMYHHVGPERAGTYREWTVSPEQFERQIRWLAKKGYSGITPSQWLRWLRDGTALPAKPVLITFDDGFAETAEFALPILRRYGFGAVMFVVTQRLGGNNTWDEAQGSGTLELMTAEQVQYWAGQGIEFGSHSRTHPDLTKLAPEACAAEVEGSKLDLAALGVQAVAFAYPFGEQNDGVRAVVRQHYALGFGTDEGFNYLRTDRDLLRRVYVGPGDSGLEFGLSVRLGGTQVLRHWRVRLGLRTRLRRLLGRATG